MTREEAIYELGEWLEQMIQHGVPIADESEQNRPRDEWIEVDEIEIDDLVDVM